MNYPEIEAPRSPGFDALYHSYDEVAKVFANFSAPAVEQGFDSRGGVPVDRSPRSEPTSRERAETFHVEASFTPPQQTYIRVTVGALNRLAHGRVHGQGKPYPTLAEEVVEVAGTDELLPFAQALRSSTLGLFTRFEEHYLNLAPALQAMVETGGSAGLSVALQHASRQLSLITDGLPTQTTLPNDRFALAHPIYPTDPYQPTPHEYEVQCSGKAFAGTVIQQGALAAERLIGSEDTETIQARLASGPVTAPAQFKRDLREKVFGIAERAGETHGSK